MSSANCQNTSARPQPAALSSQPLLRRTTGEAREGGRRRRRQARVAGRRPHRSDTCAMLDRASYAHFAQRRDRLLDDAAVRERGVVDQSGQRGAVFGERCERRGKVRPHASRRHAHGGRGRGATHPTRSGCGTGRTAPGAPAGALKVRRTAARRAREARVALRPVLPSHRDVGAPPPAGPRRPASRSPSVWRRRRIESISSRYLPTDRSVLHFTLPHASTRAARRRAGSALRRRECSVLHEAAVDAGRRVPGPQVPVRPQGSRQGHPVATLGCATAAHCRCRRGVRGDPAQSCRAVAPLQVTRTWSWSSTFRTRWCRR